MKYSIYSVKNHQEVKTCNQLLEEIFHHELSLYKMQIPDQYDKFSQYMNISDGQNVIGTYRIVFPNPHVGLPIEETGFNITNLGQDRVAEMSRLVMRKDYRGKVPFHRIIHSAREVAKKSQVSQLAIAILPQNLRLFRRHGFQQYGEPLYDYSVQSTDNKESIIIPMIMEVSV